MNRKPQRRQRAGISIFVFVLLWCCVVSAQQIQEVVCKTDPTKSYSLYLPSSYSAEKQWPILYCLDARGRGALAAELFQEAAEKYGYIIASSNNTRSDDANWPNWEAIKAMWIDSQTRFAVQQKRIYVAGFSGGARLACGMGHVFRESVAGVIGCSGGFHPQQPPSRDTSFAFFGAAGRVDFNYREMKTLDAQLEELELKHYLAIFDGGHSWPPREVCTEAIEWMELKHRSTDLPFVEKMYRKRVAKASSYEESRKWNQALSEYESIVRDFQQTRNVSAIKLKIAELKALEQIKDSLKQEQRYTREEARYIEKLRGVIARLEEPAEVVPSVSQLAQELQIAELIQRAKNEEDEEDALAAQRQLETAYVQTSFYLAQDLIKHKNYMRAISSLQLADRIKKDQPAVWYNLACVYALSGNEKKALDALQHAIASGFADGEQILKDPDLKSIRDQEEFVRLLDQLKK